MRRLIILIFLLLIIAPTGYGQTNATMILPADSTAGFSEEVTIPIFISTDSLVNEAQFVVDYDSNFIHFSNALPGKDAANFSITQIDSMLSYSPLHLTANENVLIHILGDNNSSLSGDSLELVRLTFHVRGHRGSCPLAFDQTTTRTYLKTIHQYTIADDNITFIDGLFTVQPETTAVLGFVADTLDVEQGTEFSVAVSITEVWDIHSFKLGISFDPSILRVKSVDEGSFLNRDGAESTNWTQPNVDNVAGKISNIHCSRLSEQGVDGGGELLIIHFQANAAGISVIEFIKQQTLLLDPQEREIEVKQLSPTEVNIYRQPVAELTIGDTIAAPNQMIDVPISIAGVENSSIISVLMNIAVDTTCLLPMDVITKGTLTESWQYPAVNIKGGSLIFAMAGYQPLAEDGVLVRLRYQVNPQAKQGHHCTIEFESVLLNEGDPTTITSNGSLHVRGLQLSGNVSYYGTQVPIPDIAIQLEGALNQKLVTDNEGNFSFAQLCYGDYNLFPFKHEEQENCVTPFDAALVLQQVVQLTQFSPYQMIAADVTGDSSVSALDAANILQYAVSLIDKFPVMQHPQHIWRFVPQIFPIDETNWFDAPDSLPYTPLFEDQFNQDFLGIVYGDVSQNWQLSSLTKPLTQATSSNFDHLSFGEIKEIGASQIQLPIILNTNSEVAAIQLAIEFDPNTIKLNSIEKAQSSTHFDLVFNVVENTIKIGMACAHSKPINDDLLYINFKIVNHVDHHVEFTEAIINENQSLIKTGNIFIDDSSQLPTNLELFQNYPNPFNNQTIIKYAIPNAGHVKLEIYNIVGERIRTLVDERKEVGYHTIDWHGEDEYENIAASGTYFMILKINDVKLNRKIIFMK